MSVRLSYSQIGLLYGFEACEGKWFWKYVKGLEKSAFNRNFIIGDVYHQSVGLIFAGKPVDIVVNKIAKTFKERVAHDSKDVTPSIDDMRELEKDLVAVKGMVKAYGKIRAKDIESLKLVKNESEHTVHIADGVDVLIKIDNIVEYKKKWMSHELKTAKTVDPKYVKNKQYDFQTALYFHLYNMLFDSKATTPKGYKPLSEVLYDAVQKPGLRGKKGETPRNLLARISEYYIGPEAENRFYFEPFVPNITRAQVIKTVLAAAKKAEQIRATNDFVNSYASCAWCDYNVLCFHGGETKANLSLYKRRHK